MDAKQPKTRGRPLGSKSSKTIQKAAISTKTTTHDLSTSLKSQPAGALVAISSMPDDVPKIIMPAADTGSASSTSECRRSSRKKIIKFDVRDLLASNRKSRIQIVERLDSNVPSSKNSGGQGSSASSAISSPSVSVDTLTDQSGANREAESNKSTKQQSTFIEKTTIFQRPSNETGSIQSSGQFLQTNIMPKTIIEETTTSQPKPRSLIVAQMESFSSSTNSRIRNNSETEGIEIQTGQTSQRKPRAQKKKKETEPIEVTKTISPNAPKRRVRKSKGFATVPNAELMVEQIENIDFVEVENSIEELKKEEATNWKEYKACLQKEFGSGTDLRTSIESYSEPVLKDEGPSVKTLQEESLNTAPSRLILDDSAVDFSEQKPSSAYSDALPLSTYSCNPRSFVSCSIVRDSSSSEDDAGDNSTCDVILVSVVEATEIAANSETVVVERSLDPETSNVYENYIDSIIEVDPDLIAEARDTDEADQRVEPADITIPNKDVVQEELTSRVEGLEERIESANNDQMYSEVSVEVKNAFEQESNLCRAEDDQDRFNSSSPVFRPLGAEFRGTGMHEVIKSGTEVEDEVNLEMLYDFNKSKLRSNKKTKVEKSFENKEAKSTRKGRLSRQTSNNSSCSSKSSSSAESLENQSNQEGKKEAQKSNKEAEKKQLQEKEKSSTAGTTISKEALHSVSVNTSTLIDILRTVQSNQEAAQTAVLDTTTASTPNDSENQLSQISDNLLSENTEYSSGSNDEIIQKPKDKLEKDPDSTNASKSNSPKPDSPKSDSPKSFRKTASNPTRRCERRNTRRSDENSAISKHRTLEETFAEIAAESSRRVQLQQVTGESEEGEVETNQETCREILSDTNKENTELQGISKTRETENRDAACGVEEETNNNLDVMSEAETADRVNLSSPSKDKSDEKPNTSSDLLDNSMIESFPDESDVCTVNKSVPKMKQEQEQIIPSATEKPDDITLKYDIKTSTAPLKKRLSKLHELMEPNNLKTGIDACAIIADSKVKDDDVESKLKASIERRDHNLGQISNIQMKEQEEKNIDTIEKHDTKLLTEGKPEIDSKFCSEQTAESSKNVDDYKNTQIPKIKLDINNEDNENQKELDSKFSIPCQPIDLNEKKNVVEVPSKKDSTLSHDDPKKTYKDKHHRTQYNEMEKRGHKAAKSSKEKLLKKGDNDKGETSKKHSPSSEKVKSSEKESAIKQRSKEHQHKSKEIEKSFEKSTEKSGEILMKKSKEEAKRASLSSKSSSFPLEKSSEGSFKNCSKKFDEKPRKFMEKSSQESSGTLFEKMIEKSFKKLNAKSIEKSKKKISEKSIEKEAVLKKSKESNVTEKTTKKPSKKANTNETNLERSKMQSSGDNSDSSSSNKPRKRLSDVIGNTEFKKNKNTASLSASPSTSPPISKSKEKLKKLSLDSFNTELQNVDSTRKVEKKNKQRKSKDAFDQASKDDHGSKDHFDMLPPTPSTPDRESPNLHRFNEFSTGMNQDFNQKLQRSSDSEAGVPDPLKDIEKFIEAGVNLLKRDYKLSNDNEEEDGGNINKEKAALGTKDDEAVEKNADIANETDKTRPNQKVTTEIQKSLPIMSTNSVTSNPENLLTTLSNDSTTKNQTVLRSPLYETPADTPVVTPASTPPQSPSDNVTARCSPADEDAQEDDDDHTRVRRSSRLKQISRAPKLVGHGLVRDKDRCSIRGDEVETKLHYTMDDHLMDLAEVEAKNAKFLKEQRLSNFKVIKENEYHCERIISREARKMICDCFLTAEEEDRGEWGCGEDCLNRLLMIECGPHCNVRDRCTNRRFQRFLCAPCRVFRTEKKGCGISADVEIHAGEFIMEYVGEVLDSDEFERRQHLYSMDKNRHYYFMALRSDAIIDATMKGNISRFINHSCDPNAETQKWTVNGELRIGFFSRRTIMPGEEITFDYQYQRYGREAQRCYCESSNCRGWIGEEPASDEGEQLDETDSEEDNLTKALLADGDEGDASDESISDPEEVKRRLEKAAEEAKLRPITDQDNAETKSGEQDNRQEMMKLLSKISEKMAKRKQTDSKQKRKRKPKSKTDQISPGQARFLEDPDIEKEVNNLSRSGIKNQLDTLRLSRLMVRAKLVQTRLNLLYILRNGEFPCRRLFLDYHGLRLLHGWMNESGENTEIRIAILETLEVLPVANKTMLSDSKVLQAVRNWCANKTVTKTEERDATATNAASLSPTDDSSKESSSNSSNEVGATSQEGAEVRPNDEPLTDFQIMAQNLCSKWETLPEIFRIPKRERIEQMKEHEREADRQFAENVIEKDDSNGDRTTDRYQRDRFGRSRYSKNHYGRDGRSIGVLGANSSSNMSSGNEEKRKRRNSTDLPGISSEEARNMSKEQRREIFAAHVARKEAEKRQTRERREFETKCRFFGLDPNLTQPDQVPFYVNPNTGEWFSVKHNRIPVPPAYVHVKVAEKVMSTNPDDYYLPAAVAQLPDDWSFAITTQGKIYYYHLKKRVPQWEPPTVEQIERCRLSDDSDDDDFDSDSEYENEEAKQSDVNAIKAIKTQEDMDAYLSKQLDNLRKKRYKRLVTERPISPRREEDRIYNQMEMRKYKENKEKIRKRKEEIRRRRAEALKSSVSNLCTLGSLEDNKKGAMTLDVPVGSGQQKTDDEMSGVLPIQDYLLSSDEDEINELKAECNNSPLLDKIVQGDKIVDELDALTTKRSLKRPLLPHSDLESFKLSGSDLDIITKLAAASTILSASHGEATTSSSHAAHSSSSTSSSSRHEHKRRRLERKEKSKRGKDSSDSKYRKLKEKFRCDIAGIIVQYLKPYCKDSCQGGRITCKEDFDHLARKLTHFVMIKELKYCESVGQTLVVTESVKNKSREFIRKYMSKYKSNYVKPENDPEFKEIPYTL